MKQISLIGDSIRIGYQPIVTELLADQASVWGPEENGGHTVNLLIHLRDWMTAHLPQADVIHINSGLHDLKTITPDSREQVIPLDHYRRNVRALLTALQEHTHAKLIWATTTLVIDQRFRDQYNNGADVGFLRYNEDVLAYNDAARQICGDLNIPVNDLYAVVKDAGPEKIMEDDGIHFLNEGSAVLAAAVVAAVVAAVQNV